MKFNSLDAHKEHIVDYEIQQLKYNTDSQEPEPDIAEDVIDILEIL